MTPGPSAGELLAAFYSAGANAHVHGDSGQEQVLRAWMHQIRTGISNPPPRPDGPEARLVWSLWTTYSLEPDCLARLDDCVRQARALDDELALGFASWRLAADRQNAHAPDVDQALEVAMRVARAESNDTLVTLTTMVQLNRLLLEGLLTALPAAIERLLSVNGGPHAMAYARTAAATGMTVLGEGARAGELWDDAIALFAQAGNYIAETHARAHRARLHMNQGCLDSGLALVLEVHHHGSRVTTPLLAELYAASGRFREARELMASDAVGAANGVTIFGLASDLGAACALGELEGGGAWGPNGSLPDTIDARNADHIPLLAAAAAAGFDGADPHTLAARSEALADAESAVITHGLVADRAMREGEPTQALEALERSLAWSLNAGHALRDLRSRRARQVWEVRYGNPNADALDAIAGEFLTAGDCYGAAVAWHWRAAALAADGDRAAAKAEAQHVRGVCRAGSYRQLSHRNEALLSCLGVDPRTDWPTPEHQAMGLIGTLRGGDLPARLTAWWRTVRSLPRANRALPFKLAAPALMQSSTALSREGDDGVLIIDVDAGAVWLDGERVAKMRAGSVQMGLLRAIAETDLAKEELYRQVWELPHRGASSDNSLYVAVGRLRKALGEALAIAAPGGRYQFERDLTVYIRGQT